MLSIDEAAAKFRIHRATIYRYVRLGLLKVYKRPLDKRSYVDRRALRQVLQKKFPFEERFRDKG